MAFARIHILHALTEYRDVWEPQFSDDFGKKRALLRIRLNQRDIEAWDGHRERYSWESGSGTNVGEPTFFEI